MIKSVNRFDVGSTDQSEVVLNVLLSADAKLCNNFILHIALLGAETDRFIPCTCTQFFKRNVFPSVFMF